MYIIISKHFNFISIFSFIQRHYFSILKYSLLSPPCLFNDPTLPYSTETGFDSRTRFNMAASLQLPDFTNLNNLAAAEVKINCYWNDYCYILCTLGVILQTWQLHIYSKHLQTLNQTSFNLHSIVLLHLQTLKANKHS